MPIDPPRFLCDEMLGRLCRYLRAAGYDTGQAAGGTPDAALIIQALHEGRWLLTRDRRMLEHRGAQEMVHLLQAGSLDEFAGQLARRYGLHWTRKSFTRCLVDNTPFAAATREQIARIPADAQHPGQTVVHCPSCGRVYWQGSHYRRMRERLQRWQAAQDQA